LLLVAVVGDNHTLAEVALVDYFIALLFQLLHSHILLPLVLAELRPLKAPVFLVEMAVTLLRFL
jgi:hypothetical protein